MTELVIHQDLKKISSAWRNYLAFVFGFLFYQRLIAKLYVFTLLILGILSILYYDWFWSTTRIVMLFYLGYAFLMGLKLILFYFRIIRYYKKDITRRKSLVFKYDQEGIAYDLTDVKMEFKWNRFAYFVDHGDFIFLLDEKRRPLDILSKSIIGEHHFETLKQLIQSKVKRFNKKI